MEYSPSKRSGSTAHLVNVGLGKYLMNKELSAYLDFSRFSAAMLVFFCHLDESWVRGLFPFFTHLGLEAVGVFFVLSGYVIGYVTAGRENDPLTYAINRAARVYSVVIPCLLITFLLDALGRHIWQNNYYQMDVVQQYSHVSKNLKEAIKIVASFTFFDQIWQLNITPGSDAPFWSLCFEVPYYIIFAAVFFIKHSVRWIIFAALCLLVGPKIAALFPLWFLGYLCFRFVEKTNFSPGVGRLIFASSIAVWCVCEMVRWHYSIGIGGPKGGGVMPNLWQFYIAGVPFAASVLGIRLANINIFQRFTLIRWLSGATFTLYLLHYPVAVFINTALPLYLNPFTRWSIIFVVVISLTLLVAEFTERRKSDWRAGIKAILAFFAGTSDAPKASR